MKYSLQLRNPRYLATFADGTRMLVTGYRYSDYDPFQVPLWLTFRGVVGSSVVWLLLLLLFDLGYLTPIRF